MRTSRVTRTLTAVLVASGLTLAACSKDPGSTNPAPTKSAGVPTQKVDAALRAKLPQKITDAGTLTSVNTGAFPPYTISAAGGDATKVEGASVDLEKALGELLGVKVQDTTVSGLSGELSGIASQRYDFAFGPVGDFPEREATVDFVDWVQEFVVFAVPKGNPKKITSLDSACGTRIAVQAGGSAEKVIKTQSTACTAAGKPAVEVQSYADQPTSIMAVKSGRADAFFSSQAPLTYFVKQSNGELELAGTGQANGFDKLVQGAVVPKGSPLGQVLQEALQKLFDNGTYAAVMSKWGLDGNKLDKPGLNLAAQK
ncbi:ABC transporter substrate-binding protein [Planosporangium thailandense]|uniref:ABC transporter substrate-binding protein n=1 Tax=Planosporangium thailandense TaxID=765197 RepID=A0ABX0Y7Y3_9ACTN|nr:ABC transporter substrate-binding protein [Planosporangium thailandense]NJC73512.1 ABC transporter substrate-binding protein [Planosporangium thailandense]